MSQQTVTVGRLWSQYQQVRRKISDTDGTGIPDANLEQEANHLRDRLLVNYSPLVKYVVGRVSARATGATDRGDFMSWGMLGLLNAIETFDSRREAKFETYAISKIRWAILDELRKEDWVPRRVRSRSKEIETAKNALTQKLKRTPTEKEIIDEAGIDASEYRSFLQQQSRAQVVSLEAQPDDEDSAPVGARLPDEKYESPEEFAERDELQSELTSAMKNLDDRERTVVTLYFYEGLTLKEIGQALQVTEGRISQILSRTLGKLRGMISDDYLISGNLV